jgi:hypothetical protein
MELGFSLTVNDDSFPFRERGRRRVRVVGLEMSRESRPSVVPYQGLTLHSH